MSALALIERCKQVFLLQLFSAGDDDVLDRVFARSSDSAMTRTRRSLRKPIALRIGTAAGKEAVTDVLIVELLAKSQQHSGTACDQQGEVKCPVTLFPFHA